MERLHHLCPKTESSRQGERPHGVTCRVRRPGKMKETAKRSHSHEKTPLRSLRHHGKTACHLLWRCADPVKSKLSASVKSL